jgi:hypothetical protein
MVYGELGRYPMELQIKIKMLCFWSKFVGIQVKSTDYYLNYLAVAIETYHE